ncbi:MAG: hypothetical protein MJE66_17270 [Proteobacteria bacterium]|nr:hypothetical protein [Pseudomonadota bacterium]
MIARLQPLWTALVTAAVLLSPRVVLACSVCSAGREDESAAAFIWMTVFLSVLPLAIVGGAVFWLWRHSKRRAEPEPELAPQSTPVEA